MRRRLYKRPFILYHWSPVSRRASILKRGLRVSSRPTQCQETWPHLCFSDSPSLAWALSAWAVDTDTDTETEWDLWMCWSNVTDKPIGRRDDIPDRPTEFRVFESIPKSKLWLVGTRENKRRRRGGSVCEGDGRGG